MPENGFGPDGQVMTGAAPFSVTGPTTVDLDGARTATVSFAVSNVTGRPVRARLIPQPLEGADPTWLSVVGDAERPMGVAATMTADVRITVGPQAPAGKHALRLDVSVEDQPDLVTAGQSVAFTVPAVVKKPFPMWIVLVAVIAVVVLALGGGTIWFLTRDKAPESVKVPTISGDPVVGNTLTSSPGAWKGGQPISQQWQVCTGTDVATCKAITGALADKYVLGPADEGKTLRIIELASTGPVDKDGKVPGPTTQHASALTKAVQPPPTPMATVPPVAGMKLSQATQKLAAAKLQALQVSTGVVDGSCDPQVISQNPGPNAQIPVGSKVALAANNLPKWCFLVDFKYPLMLEERQLKFKNFQNP